MTRQRGVGRVGVSMAYDRVFDPREAHTGRDFNFLIYKKRHMDPRLWWTRCSDGYFSLPLTSLRPFQPAASSVLSLFLHQFLFLLAISPCGQPAQCGDPADSPALVKMASFLP